MVEEIDSAALVRPKWRLVWFGVWVVLAELGLVVAALVVLTAVEVHIPVWIATACVAAISAIAGWQWRTRLATADARTALSVVAIVWAATALSVRWPGGITAASHGITVIGAFPVLAVDVTIDASGSLGFRPKSHRVSWTEVGPLAEGAEVVVVATGWAGAAVVDDDVIRRLRGRLEVATTGAAIQRYQLHRAHGRRVALLAHTTC